MPSPAEDAVRTTIGEMAARAHRETMRGGREKLAKSAPLWRRVTDGDPCGFCAMVASRGPVYTSESAAGAAGNRYHVRCGCSVEPYFGDPADWEPSPEEARFLEAYRESYYTGIDPDELADRIESYLLERADRFDSRWRVGRRVHVAKADAQELAEAEYEARLARSALDLAEDGARPLRELIDERRRYLMEDEGLTLRKANSIMNKQKDVQGWQESLDIQEGLAADARRDLDRWLKRMEDLRATENLPDFDPSNPLSFYGDRIVFHDESAKAAEFARDWEMFDEDAHRLIRDYFAEVDGGGAYFGDSAVYDLDDFGYLRGEFARGSDASWDIVGGVHNGGRRVVACGHHGWRNSHHSTALHEGCHALDSALGGYSDTKAWREAMESALSDRISPYFHPAGNPEGWLSESFAEVGSYYQRGRAEGLSGDGLALFIAGGMTKRSDLHVGRTLLRAIETALGR